MKRIMEKIKEWIPPYARIPLIIVLAYNTAVYNGARMIAGGWKHYDLSIPAIDGAVPLVPWTVLIYFGCYIFWVVNYILGTRKSRTEAHRFAAADMMGKTVCLIFFLCLPTTLPRPQIAGNGWADQLMKFLYFVDASDNLFPSIHCLVSWLSYIAVRGDKEIPLWYRSFSLVFALAICVSTLTTKQHVFVDTIAGVFLAEAGWWLSGIWMKRRVEKRRLQEDSLVKG